MALTEVKVRNSKPAEKPVKLTNGSGMHLLIQPSGSNIGVCNTILRVNKKCWPWVFIQRCHCLKLVVEGMKQDNSLPTALTQVKREKQENR